MCQWQISVMSGAYLLQNATEQVPNHVILNGFHSEDSDQAIQQRLPVQQQNVKSSRVYVFGADDVDEQEINTDRIEMTEVRARGKARNHNLPKTVVDDVPQFINYQIKDGDTLQNIALKFACPVSMAHLLLVLFKAVFHLVAHHRAVQHRTRLAFYQCCRKC